MELYAAILIISSAICAVLWLRADARRWEPHFLQDAEWTEAVEVAGGTNRALAAVVRYVLQRGYRVEHFSADDNAIVVSTRTHLFEYGVFFAVNVMDLGDGRTRIEVSVVNKPGARTRLAPLRLTQFVQGVSAAVYAATVSSDTCQTIW